MGLFTFGKVRLILRGLVPLSAPRLRFERFEKRNRGNFNLTHGLPLLRLCSLLLFAFFLFFKENKIKGKNDKCNGVRQNMPWCGNLNYSVSTAEN